MNESDNCKTVTLSCPLPMTVNNPNRHADTDINTYELCQLAAAGERLELNVSFRQLTDSDVDQMIDILNSGIATRVETLILKRNWISDEGAHSLANALERAANETHASDAVTGMLWAKYLTRLDLSKNEIGEEGAVALLNALRKCRGNIKLRRLDMAFTGNITDETRVGIAVEILRNITDASNQLHNSENFGEKQNVEQLDSGVHFVPELHLSGQFFGDEAVDMLCTALKGNTTLKRLHLDDNDVSEKGAQSILRLLESNFTLQYLDLEGNNHLKSEHKDEIGACLVRNRNIQGLYLQRYSVDDGPPVHRSRTSEVVFGKDMKQTPPAPVALKKMKNREQFERELRCRMEIKQNHTLRKEEFGVVVDVVGWHAPEDVDIPAIDIPRRDESCEECEEYILVMPKGHTSLWQSLGSQRIARYDVQQSLSLVHQIVVLVQHLHDAGLVHCDLKPRNILISDTRQLILCDLDAAVPIGELRPQNLKSSTAYSPPELIRHYNNSNYQPTDTGLLRIEASFDVWSIGVILFEVLTGRHLFPQDISDDNMVDEASAMQLSLWLCINDALLDIVLKECDSVELRLNAHYLIRWCLQGDPTLRPSISDILTHSLFSGGKYSPPDTLLSYPSYKGNKLFKSIISQNGTRMKYHVFISHFQMEASGDVGTLYHMLENLGVHVWRDMNTRNLTETAMRQGVFDSDVFVLFLTNSALSRSFCLKEVGWALEFGKPVTIIVEREERFWAWDWTRWTHDKCSRVPGVLNTWRKGRLQNYFDDVYSQHHNVYTMIKKHHEEKSMLPFRRRKFEVNALVQELLRRAEEQGVTWKLPLTITDRKNVDLLRRSEICIVSPPNATSIANAMRNSLTLTFPSIQWVDVIGSDTNVIVILTSQTLPSCEKYMSDIVERNSTVTNNDDIHAAAVLFIYSVELGWDFADFYERPDDDIKDYISANEALTHRTLPYEHHALCSEILRRIYFTSNAIS